MFIVFLGIYVLIAVSWIFIARYREADDVEWEFAGVVWPLGLLVLGICGILTLAELARARHDRRYWEKEKTRNMKSESGDLRDG